MKIYKVLLNGVDMNHKATVFLTWAQALREYQIYKGQGYKDVKIVDTTTKEQ